MHLAVTFTFWLLQYSLVLLQTANSNAGACIKSRALGTAWTCSSTVILLSYRLFSLHYTFDVGTIPSTCTAKSARPSSRNTNCANCHVRATHRLLMNTNPRAIVCKERNATCAQQILVTSDSHQKDTVVLPVFVFQWIWTAWGKLWWRESVLQWRAVQRMLWEEWQIPDVWCQFCRWGKSYCESVCLEYVLASPWP